MHFQFLLIPTILHSYIDHIVNIVSVLGNIIVFKIFWRMNSKKGKAVFTILRFNLAKLLYMSETKLQTLCWPHELLAVDDFHTWERFVWTDEQWQNLKCWSWCLKVSLLFLFCCGRLSLVMTTTRVQETNKQKPKVVFILGNSDVIFRGKYDSIRPGPITNTYGNHQHKI